MAIDLDTSVPQPTLEAMAVSEGTKDYSEKVIYPSSNDPLITVAPNTMVIVTAYFTNVAADATGAIHISKVLRTNGKPAHSDGSRCSPCAKENEEPSKIAHMVDIPNWFLNQVKPIFVFKTPGTYLLQIDNAIQDVIVTAEYIKPIQEVNCGLDGCT